MTILNAMGANVMREASAQMARVAQNVANAHTPGYAKLEPYAQAPATYDPGLTPSDGAVLPGPVNTVDLAEEMVHLIQVEHMYSLGVTLFEAEAGMLQDAIDLKR